MNEREGLHQLEALTREGQLDRAQELGKELSDAFPGSFQVQFAYAGVLRRVDELDRAREILLELLRRYPENINLLLSLAEICRRRKDDTGAREYYSKVLFLDPFNQAARDAQAALGTAPAAQPAPPSAPPPSRPAAASAPVRVEVDLEHGEPGADFEIRLDEVHPEEEEVRPDETPTLDLDEAGIPRPEVAEREEAADSIPAAVPEFGLPLEAPDLEPPPVVEPPAPAPPPAPEPAEEKEPPAPVLRVPREEAVPPPPEPDLSDTGPLQVESPPEVEDEADGEEEGAEKVEFFTESAAGLYAAQGLWSEAAEIYRELHRRSGDDRYLARIRDLDRRRLARAKIERLKQLLADLKGRDGGAGVR